MRKIQREILLKGELFLAMFFWGGSWAVTKLVIDYTDDIVLAFWRFVLAVLASLPIMFFLHTPLLIPKRALIWVLLAGLLYALYVSLFFAGVRSGLAGAGGVLVTTLIPILTYLILFLLYRNPLGKSEKFGLLLGLFSGAVMLKINEPSHLLESGNLYLIAAAFVWVFVTLCLQKVEGRASPITMNFYMNLISLLVYGIFVWNHPATLEVFSFGISFWASLFFLSVLATIVGNAVYYQAVIVLGGQKASAFNLLVPIHALLMSWLLVHETPTIHILIGGALAICAIYFINFRSKK